MVVNYQSNAQIMSISHETNWAFELFLSNLCPIDKLTFDKLVIENN